MVICRARGDWIPSLKWPPNSPRWAPTVTWSYLDALHRNVGEISEFLLNVGVEFTKKIDVRKGWVMARLGFVSLVCCICICMTRMAALRLMRYDAIFPIVKSFGFVWTWFLFSNEQGGSFSAFTSESLPHLSSLVSAVSADPDPFLYGDVPKDPKKNAMRIYEDYVDRRKKNQWIEIN